MVQQAACMMAHIRHVQLCLELLVLIRNRTRTRARLEAVTLATDSPGRPEGKNEGVSSC